MRTVVHISDLHFGRDDRTLVDALASSIAADAPDLIAVSGDLTQRARRREFAAARAFLDRLRPVPMIVVPGNHDVPLYNVVRRFARPLSRFERFVGAGRSTVFHDAEIAVLGLNTARSLTFKQGRISFAQMSEIRRAFAVDAAPVLKVLVIHHPLAPAPDAPERDRVGRWRSALAHHHGFSGALALPASQPETVAGSVLLVHAGTAVSTRTRGAEPNSYNLIRSEGGRLAVVVRPWDGSRFAEGPRRTFEFVGGQWRAASPRRDGPPRLR